MAEETDPKTPPAGGETNEQKAEREAKERELNEAEARVTGWTKKAMADYFKENPLSAAPTTPATSSEKTAAKKSLLEKVLGL
jgi:hypothetical protein